MTIMRLTLIAAAGKMLAEGRLTNWATIAFVAVILLGTIVIAVIVRFGKALRDLESSLAEQAQKIEKLQRVAGLSPPEE